MGAEGLPCPVVVDPALRHGEDGVGRGPHGEPLVRKEHGGIDAVPVHVPQPVERVGAGLGSQKILALELRQAQPVGPVAFAHAPLHAVLVGDDAGQALLVLLVDPVEPERRRLVDVLVGGDDEVLPGGAGAGGARPAGVAGGLEAPKVRGVHRHRVHRVASHRWDCSRLRVPSSSGP